MGQKETGEKLISETRRVLQKGILALEWDEFEKLTAAMFEAEGYDVEMTPVTDDQGIDLKLHERSSGTLDVAQCKHWKSEVGSPVVRDFYGAMTYFQARKGFLVVCAGVTKSALEFVQGTAIEIVTLDSITDRLLRLVGVTYKQGHEKGYEDGHEKGYQKGYQEGYEVGRTSKIVLP